MAFNRQNESIILGVLLILPLIAIPVIATTNIDCKGKAFHCVNSTHFKICVDFGGVSKTVDDFLIPCPPSTVCTDNNFFECEYEIMTTSAPLPVQSDATNELFEISATTVPDIFELTTLDPKIELSQSNTAPSKLTSTLSPETVDKLNTPGNDKLIEVISNSENKFHKTTISDLSESESSYVKLKDFTQFIDVNTGTTTIITDVSNDDYDNFSESITTVPISTENYSGIVTKKTINFHKPVTDVLSNMDNMKLNVNFTLISTASNDDKFSTVPVNVASKSIAEEISLDETNNFSLTTESTINNDNATMQSFSNNNKHERVARKMSNNTVVDFVLNKNGTLTRKMDDMSSVLPKTHPALKIKTYNEKLRLTDDINIALNNSEGQFLVNENEDLSSPNISEHNLISENIATTSSSDVVEIISTYSYIEQDTNISEINSATISIPNANESYTTVSEISSNNTDFIILENGTYTSNIDVISAVLPNVPVTSGTNMSGDELGSTTVKIIALANTAEDSGLKKNNGSSLSAITEINLLPENAVNLTISNNNSNVAQDIKIGDANPTTPFITDANEFYTNIAKTPSDEIVLDFIKHEKETFKNETYKISSLFPSANMTTVANRHKNYSSSKTTVKMAFANTEREFTPKERNDLSLSVVTETNLITKNIVTKSSLDILNLTNSTNSFVIWDKNATMPSIKNSTKFYKSKLYEISTSPATTLEAIIHNDKLSSTTPIYIPLDTVGELSVKEKNDSFLPIITKIHQMTNKIVTQPSSHISDLINTDLHNTNIQQDGNIWDTNHNISTNKNELYTISTKNNSDNTVFEFATHENETYKSTVNNTSPLLPRVNFTSKANIHDKELNFTTASHIASANSVGEVIIKENNNLSSLVITESNVITEANITKPSSENSDLKHNIDLFDVNTVDAKIWNVSSTKASITDDKEFYKNSTQQNKVFNNTVPNFVIDENDTYKSKVDQTSSLLPSANFLKANLLNVESSFSTTVNVDSQYTEKVFSVTENNEIISPQTITDSYLITENSIAKSSDMLDFPIATDSQIANMQHDKKVSYINPSTAPTTNANELYINAARNTTDQMGIDVLIRKNKTNETKTIENSFISIEDNPNVNVFHSDATKDVIAPTLTKYRSTVNINSNLTESTINLHDPLTVDTYTTNKEKNMDVNISTTDGSYNFASSAITIVNENLNSVDKLQTQNSYPLNTHSFELAQNIENSTNFIDLAINTTHTVDKEQYTNVNSSSTTKLNQCNTLPTIFNALNVGRDFPTFKNDTPKNSVDNITSTKFLPYTTKDFTDYEGNSYITDLEPRTELIIKVPSIKQIIAKNVSQDIDMKNAPNVDILSLGNVPVNKLETENLPIIITNKKQMFVSPLHKKTISTAHPDGGMLNIYESKPSLMTMMNNSRLNNIVVNESQSKSALNKSSEENKYIINPLNFLNEINMKSKNSTVNSDPERAMSVNKNNSTFYTLPANASQIKESTKWNVKFEELNVQNQFEKSSVNQYLQNTSMEFNRPSDLINDSMYSVSQSRVNSIQNTTIDVRKQDYVKEPILEMNNNTLQTTYLNIGKLNTDRKNENHNVSVNNFNNISITINKNQDKQKSMPINLSLQDIAKLKSSDLTAKLGNNSSFSASSTSTNVLVNNESALINYKYLVEGGNHFTPNQTKEVENIQIFNFSEPVADENNLKYKYKNVTIEKINKNRDNVTKSQTASINKFAPKEHERTILPPSFGCNNLHRGKYSDKEDCKKFYICLGRSEPIIGRCPNNTVFSEILKQCTKNLSHCIINNQFRCVSTGRYADIFSDQFYYICVKKVIGYIRFKLQCQKGYHLNKLQLQCVLDSPNGSISNEDSSKIDYDNSTNESKSKEIYNLKNKKEFDCKKEGKFVYPDDCRKFYECTRNGKSEFRRKVKKCDSDKVFNKKKCVDEDSYECNN